MTTSPTIFDPLQTMLDRLHGVKVEKDDQWVALCPAHDDHHQSLSIGVGDTQPVVFKCMADCDKTAILDAIDLTWGDILPPSSSNGQKRKRDASLSTMLSDKNHGKTSSKRATPPTAYKTFDLAIAAGERQTRGKHADTWTYHKTNGDGHFQVARFDTQDSKTYRPYHLTKRGWVQTDPKGKLSLYRSPELLNADTVYSFEGEKCADAARKLGLTATTSAHGCKSPHKSDWTPLAGKQVVVFPDNDTAGRKYAQKVAAILTSLDPPATVKIVELPGLEEHGDIVDFIADRRMDAKDDAAIRIEIKALAEQAPTIEPTPPTEALVHATSTTVPSNGGLVVSTSTKSQVKAVKLDKIRLDGKTQIRATISDDVVAEYAEARKAGAVLPPIVVFFDGSDYWLSDGFHRVRSAKRNGAKSIRADVRTGTCRDAILYAVGANTSHGLRRTNQDKRNAVKALLEDKEWVKWSDNEVAKRCAVSHTFVGSVRVSLATLQATNSTSDTKKEDSGDRTYTDKHGNESTMDTTNIGGSSSDGSHRNSQANVEARQEVRSTSSDDPFTKIGQFIGKAMRLADEIGEGPHHARLRDLFDDALNEVGIWKRDAAKQPTGGA